MNQESGMDGKTWTNAVMAPLVLMLLLSFPPAAWGQVGPPAEVINQARKAATITPSDTVDLVQGATRFVYLPQATACNIAVIFVDDTVAITLAIPVSTNPDFIPMRVKRVMATNTTCTPIIGMW
jgi:hypothetical protein